MLQPLDVGYNAEFKKAVADCAQEHMKSNLEKWTLGSFTASERRVLITKWVNDNAPIERLFEKCGISLPFDGSLDDRISIGGLENFTVPNVGEVDEDDTEDVEPGNDEIELDGSVAVEDDVVEDLSM